MFRVRDKQLTAAGVAGSGTISTGTAANGEVEEINKSTVFYNCYVYYRQELYGDRNAQKASAPDGLVTFGTASDAKLMRQAVVVVSKWPFPQLAFRLLGKLDDGLVWNADTSINGSICATNSSLGGWKDTPQDSDNIRESERSSGDGPGSLAGQVGGVDVAAVNTVFMTGFAQVAVWPAPKPGTQMYLHFLGELLQYSVASDVLSTYGANLSLSTAFSSMNLVTMLGPLGLMQHVWVLWELLVTGQDIVVMAATPTQCSELVMLLTSLILPLAHAGDIRPYMHPDDSDLAILAATAKKKRIQQATGQPTKEVGTSSMIVGVCDPAALEKLSSFSAVLLLTPQGSGSVADPDAVFKGLRKKNAAQCVQLDQRGFSAMGLVGKVVTKKPDSGWVTFVDYFNGWLEHNNSIGPANSLPLIVCKIEPSALTIRKTLTKIKNMHPKDRNVLGDKLVRDNLRELTLAFFKPNTSEGQTIESANLQQTAQLRAVAMSEAQKQAIAEARLAKGTVAIIIEDIMVGVQRSLPWLSRNVPTVFLWITYALVLLITRLSGLPTVLLIGTAFVVKIPMKAPKAFEKTLQKFVPESILYPPVIGDDEPGLDEANLSARADAAAKASSAAAGPSSGGSKAGKANGRVGTGRRAGRLDLSGVWKRVRMENYDNFLAAQGAPFMQRKIAASLPLAHTFTFSKDLMAFNLVEKGGPIDSDFNFICGGPAVATNLAKATFLDTCTWDEGKLKVVKLRTPEKAYELRTWRWLEDDGNSIHTMLTHVDLKTNKETTANVWFAYQGPSPNDRPASVNPADEVDEADAEPEAGAAAGAADLVAAPAAGGAKHKDLSGVWNRTKSVNFEAVIGATGAGFMQRKIAASMALCHTITLDPTMQAMRMQEKGGPINIDFTLTIGAPDTVPYDNNGKKLAHKAYWDGEALIMHRIVLDGNYELVNKRVLDESTDVKQLVCTITFRDLKTGNEVEGTSWFSYAGPSPNPAPVPDLSKLPKVVAPVDNKAATAAAAAAELDQDDDEDTDEVAVQKMRNSVMQPSSAASRLFAPAVGGSMGSGRVGGSIQQQQQQNQRPRQEADSALRPNFSGLWERDMGSAPTISSKFKLSHSIKLDATTFHMRELNYSGRVQEDLLLVIGAAPIEKAYGNKKLMCSCFFEGATLVVQQVNTAEAYETFVRRNLEENDSIIRLTATQRSLTTGEESESMSLFHLRGRTVQ